MGMLWIGDSVANGDVIAACHRHNVSSRRFFDLDVLQSVVNIKLGHLDLFHLAVGLTDRDPLAVADRPIADAANAYAANVVAIVDVGNEQLKILARVKLRWWNAFDNRLEQRT